MFHNYSHIGGSEIEASNFKKTILNSTDNVIFTGTIYYVSMNGNDTNDGKSLVSPVRTLDADIFKSNILKHGDAVLFERGGLWRVQKPIECVSGVFYGAYGEGEKPKFYASLKNYATDNSWRASPSRKNVWIADLRQTDAGIVCFDGKDAGVKKLAHTFRDAELKENGDFYHDVYSGHIFLYCDKGNPEDIFESIEIGLNYSIFDIPSNVFDVTIDNLSIKYSGAFGIKGCSNNRNINIKNCEIGWIGGSILSYDASRNFFIQYGNGIQFWYRAYDICVDHCYIHQIFDAAFTFQGSGVDKTEFYDISFTENLVEYTSMNFECWAGIKGKNSSIHNIKVNDNIFRFSGYGWGGLQRPTVANQAFLLFWFNVFEDMQNFVISNNIFDCADSNFLYCSQETIRDGLTIIENTYYQKETTGNNPYTEIFRNSGKYAENQDQFEVAIKDFDQNPKLIKWLD